MSGHLFIVAAPSGAGKTTLVRLLTTLTPVQQGQIRIFGLDAGRRTMDIRQNLGYVPQQLSIESALTGRQNVDLFARLYDVPRRDRRGLGVRGLRLRLIRLLILNRLRGDRRHLIGVIDRRRGGNRRQRQR